MNGTLADLPVEVTGNAIGAQPVADDGGISLVSPDITVNIRSGDEENEEDDDFYENLAESFGDEKLGTCVNQLWTDIQADIESRKGWLDTRTKGLGLLGLELLEPRGDSGASTAPVEGMSTVTAPLLLSEVLRAQATARGELLPASGPVKVLDESTYGTAERDELADALEKDLNTYLTKVATEYYPDTDRMLFYVAFGGVGYKKGYHCPLRRRPVSESVDAAYLIVDSGASDLRSARRITHEIPMRESMIKRMMLAGAYRKIEIGTPSSQPNEAKKKEAEIQGIDIEARTTQDTDHTLYETCFEWDFGEGPEDLNLALPYKITFDRDTRGVFELRRNWKRDDPMYMMKMRYVRYPYIDAIGLNCIGLLHILGNTERSLTAALREMLDAGMFANFPGFLTSAGMGRQDTNEIRVPPGGGMPIETGGMPIKDAVMPLPYKDVSPSLMALVEKLFSLGKELAGSADIPVAEGIQNAPVGTVLALLEQATRIMSAIHKRQHAAQAEEFQMLKELLKEDPAAFWEHGHRKVYEWDKQTFLKAIEEFELAPVADPNMPTQTHRLLKATGLKVLQGQSPELYDGKAVDAHILREIGFSNPDQFFAKQQGQPPPDPRIVASQVKQQDTMLREKGRQASEQAKIVAARIKAQAEEADRRMQEKLEREKLQVQRQKIGADLSIEAMEHHSAEVLAHEPQGTEGPSEAGS